MKRFGILLAAAAAGAGHAADGISLGTGADYSTGRYGGDVTTEILSIPVTARVDSGNWSLRATLPWLRVSGDPNVLPAVGLVDNLNPLGRGRSGLVGTPGADEAPERGTASGVGDLTLAAVYAVPAAGTLGVDLGVNAKIATADEDRGLGTGANDYGVSVDLHRDFDGTMVFGGVGRTWLGSSSYIDVDAVNSGNIGISQAVGRSRIGALYEHRGAAAASFDDHRDVIAFYSVPGSGNGRLQVYASHGLSDGSPDWGAGIALRRGF